MNEEKHYHYAYCITALFPMGTILTYANEQNDIEEKAKEAGGNEVDNKIEVDDHEQIDNDRNLTNFNTSEFEIQPNSTGVTIAKYLGAGICCYS